MNSAKLLRYRTLLEHSKPNLVISTGPAGTGKTMMPCQVGMTHVRNQKYDRVILTRPLVTIDSESIGYLPGDIESKTTPWMSHMLDYCGSDITQQQLRVHPLGFLRGHTFHNTFIIADEMQNSTISQMKTLLTRVGKNSKIVITGDLGQSDLDVEINGLQDFIDKFDEYTEYCNDPDIYNHIKTITFDHNDIMRSEFVKKIYDIYRLH